MAASVIRQQFIGKTRLLANSFIASSDAFNALSAELQISDLLLPEAEGGFSPDDFAGMNSDITAADILAFYQAVQAMLLPLTPEQKRALYKVRVGAQSMGPVGPLG